MKTDRRPRQTFAYAVENGFNADTRTLRAVISTANKDRHGEVVEPRAFEPHIAHFMANPVVLAGHQHRLADGSVPVIGIVEELAFYDDRVEAQLRFAPADVNELGPRYERAYELGFMRAFSVGFIPIEIRVEEGEPFTHTESELIELSAVAVPSNRQSLSGTDAKGVAELSATIEATPGFEDDGADPDSGAVYLLVDPEVYAAEGVCKGFVNLGDQAALEDVRARAFETATAVRERLLADVPVQVRSWISAQTAKRSVDFTFDKGTSGTMQLDGVTDALSLDEIGKRLKADPSLAQRVIALVRAEAPDAPAAAVDATDDAPAAEPKTVTLDADSVQALNGAKAAIGEAAESIQDAAIRIERAVSALLGSAEDDADDIEAERAPDPHMTPTLAKGTLEALDQVLQKRA